MSLDRDALLLPEKVLVYPVDGLEIFGDSPPPALIRRAAEEFAAFYREIGDQELAGMWERRAASERQRGAEDRGGRGPLPPFRGRARQRRLVSRPGGHGHRRRQHRSARSAVRRGAGEPRRDLRVAGRQQRYRRGPQRGVSPGARPRFRLGPDLRPGQHGDSRNGRPSLRRASSWSSSHCTRTWCGRRRGVSDHAAVLCPLRARYRDRRPGLAAGRRPAGADRRRTARSWRSP